MEKPNRVATVGQLRSAIEGIPDGTPLIVNAEDHVYPGFVDEQVITSIGFGTIDWGDGHGLEPDSVFALNCHADGGTVERLRHKPIRPAAGTAPAAEPEAAL